MELTFYLTVYLRVINIALVVFVLALCYIKLFTNEADDARRMRIIALAFLALSIGVGHYEALTESFSMRIPLATIGLCCAAQGMRRMSLEPETFRQKVVPN